MDTSRHDVILALPMKNLFWIIFSFIFFPLIVLATNTEALLSLAAQREATVFAALGRYEYIAPIIDNTGGQYQTNHIEQWCGKPEPCAVGYEVVYTNNLNQIKIEASAGFENRTTDWTPIPQLNLLDIASATPKL